MLKSHINPTVAKFFFIHHFFVAYDRMQGAWLKFDVVTDLRYGKPFRMLRVDLTTSCLRQRQ